MATFSPALQTVFVRILKETRMATVNPVAYARLVEFLRTPRTVQKLCDLRPVLGSEVSKFDAAVFRYRCLELGLSVGKKFPTEDIPDEEIFSFI